MTHLSHPFDTQKTLQLPNSSVGKIVKSTVSYIVSPMKVVIMSLICIIGWFSLSLAISWMLLQTFGSDITFISSNFRSFCSPDFPNCPCRLVEPSIPTVPQLVFGATIPWFLASPYDLIYDISDLCNNYYRNYKGFTLVWK